MKVLLKSYALKKMLNSSEVNTDKLKEICIFEDKDVPLLKNDNDMIDVAIDYGIIADQGNIDRLTFSNVTQRLVELVLVMGMPKKVLGFFNSTLDVSKFSNTQKYNFKNIEELYISFIKSTDGEKKDFEAVSSMQNLKKIGFFGSHMAVDLDKLYENIPFPEKIEEISFLGSLPNPSIMARFTGVKKITISSVLDSEKINAFLTAMPLEYLEKLDICNCNLENISLENFSRLHSVKEFELTNNQNANYNEILDSLQTNEDLESLILINEKGSNDIRYRLNFEILKKFKNLKELKTSNFDYDKEELKDFLTDDCKLNTITLRKFGIKDLKFLEGAQKSLTVIIEDDIDFGIIDLNSARTQECIYVKNIVTGREVMTKSVGDEKFELSFDINSGDLYIIEKILSEAENIKDANVRIGNGLISPIYLMLLPNIEKCENGYMIFAEDFSQISLEDVDELNKGGKLVAINVSDRFCDKGILNRFKYSPEKYKLIKEKIMQLTQDIPKNISELQKFMIVYRRIGAGITYDYGVSDDEFSKYAKDNIDDSRNMINGMLRGTCVCAEYSDILYNCLREIGVECFKITGIGNGGYHQWNKVQIDNLMYNTDLTWDATEIARGKIGGIKNCLLGDIAFEKYGHKAQCGIKDRCVRTYSRKEVSNAWRFAMSFDNIIKERKIGTIEKIQSKVKGFFGKEKNSNLQSLPEPKTIVSDESKKIAPWELSNIDKEKINRRLSEVSKANMVQNKKEETEKSL